MTREFVIHIHSNQMPDLSKRIITGLIFFILFLTKPLCSKANDIGEEVSVFVSLHANGVYVPALLQEETLYLPFKELFDFLKINNRLSPAMDSAAGFLIDVRSVYLVDYVHKQIQFNNTSFPLSAGELIRTATNLYLRSDVFGKVFGLNCIFQFRNLAVTINTKLDLPLLRDLRQQTLRNNIRKLTGEVKPDTLREREYPFLRLGTADWNIVHSKEQTKASNTRFNLKLGGMFAGGEALISLNYDSKLFFAPQQQQYKWRFVNNNLGALKQVSLGNLAVQAMSSIYAPVLGVQVTNSSTNLRRSFGSYVISEHTQPDWVVELYVNNVLVDYVRADASGFYSFRVPLVYGNSQITLKFFGPSGEERSSEKIIQVPFNFLPVNTFEYILSGGVVQDSLHSRFSKADFRYGLSNCITVGAGMEYLSSVKTGTRMPFFYTTLRLAKTALLSAEYTTGVRWKSLFTLQLRSRAQLELSYQRYSKGQKAILTNNLEERIASVSLPVQKRSFFLLSKFVFRQVVTPAIGYDSLIKVTYGSITKSKYTSAELVLSTSFSRFNANLSTAGFFYRNFQTNLYSNIAFAYHFGDGLMVRPQFQYNYNGGKVIATKFETEKRLSNGGLVNLSFSRDFSAHVITVSVGLRYDFSFLRTAFGAVRNNKITTLVQSAGGSLLYDATSGYATHSRQSYSGRGSLEIAPFLDLNGNGKRDIRERGISGLRVRINGGRLLATKEEDIIRIADLEPYTNYMLELDEKSLGNIAWQLKHKKIRVVAEPNVFKRLDVPVNVVGEASGIVHLDNDIAENNRPRTLINFYDSSGRMTAQTVAEGDGYFSYLGLAPGNYTARIDTVLLHTLNFSSVPATLSFQIAASEEGVIADGLKFVLYLRNRKESQRSKGEHR